MFRQIKKRVANRRNFADDDLGRIEVKGHGSEDDMMQYDILYPTKLAWYRLPPNGEITLEQFETWAIDRLKVLLELESLWQRNKSMKEIETVIKPVLSSKLNLGNDIDSKKKDYYSHFILRLCFCRSKELRDKFVRAESLLFKIRFQMLTTQDQLKFISSLDLPYLEAIDEDEKLSLSTELYQTVSHLLIFQLNLTEETQRRQFFNREKYYKLPMENVMDLVGSRQIFVKRGWAYVPQFQQLNLISNEFSECLQTELMSTYQMIPKLNEDDRILPILHHLSSGYVVTESQELSGTSVNDEFTHRTVKTKKVMEHFPLCASQLMEQLQANHHLRYQGRQQLSFFLKGIGLSVDEALQFWTDSFTSGGKITVDQFNKEYRYNFRHNYGLEGNRINYKPWDCRTILSKPRPSRGEYHGCPYRDYHPDKLVSTLKDMSLTQQQVNSVVESCQQQDYTIACTKVFEAVHQTTTSDLQIVHPNQYFERSRQCATVTTTN
ncbi:unnamed protein product [Kluyveromyces dobzhanskii CBS 2104]|uniref:DNA primase large subunit n=1 Tax=Kluyveromyces dobzhanskii CBS 2104 TaxID=1427455 RepID=A0A0A8L8Z7_9SACH|nr:unnamed protein product [Kluyveromyces dobzhanskii CBS 2104]